MSEEHTDPIAFLIELPGIYDGWSIAVHHDGSRHNRWDDGTGHPVPGFERRWHATQDAIAEMSGHEYPTEKASNE